MHLIIWQESGKERETLAITTSRPSKCTVLGTLLTALESRGEAFVLSTDPTAVIPGEHIEVTWAVMSTPGITCAATVHHVGCAGWLTAAPKTLLGSISVEEDETSFEGDLTTCLRAADEPSCLRLASEPSCLRLASEPSSDDPIIRPSPLEVAGLRLASEPSSDEPIIRPSPLEVAAVIFESMAGVAALKEPAVSLESSAELTTESSESSGELMVLGESTPAPRDTGRLFDSIHLEDVDLAFINPKELMHVLRDVPRVVERGTLLDELTSFDRSTLRSPAAEPVWWVKERERVRLTVAGRPIGRHLGRPAAQEQRSVPREGRSQTLAKKRVPSA